MSKINHLIAAYRQLHLKPCDVVLATIVETFGSTYQKAGARMLITRNGELTGLLGGGCFEGDLIEHARSVFETGIAKTLFYDMRSPDDAIWGLGLGCNGAVRIFLQLLTAPDDFRPLSLIAEVEESQQPGMLVTICESLHPDFPLAHSLFLSEASLQDPQPPGLPLPAAIHNPRLETHIIGGQLVKAFYDPIRPVRQLLIAGAGADAIPLLRCAKALGWKVSVADHRPSHLHKPGFLEADALLSVLPEALAESLDLSRFSAAVLMTHNVDFDRRFLKSIADSNIPFIGLLGPVHRRDCLLESLGEAASKVGKRVFGPVGLDIGAQTPEEIALSIMAGILAESKGRSGGQLSPSGNVCLHEFLSR